MKTLSLDPKKVEVIDGDYENSKNWKDSIDENGYLQGENSWILLKSENNEISIDFDMYITGSSVYDPGDDYVAPYYESFIDNVDIEVKNVLINEVEVKLTPELIKKISFLIESII